MRPAPSIAVRTASVFLLLCACQTSTMAGGGYVRVTGTTQSSQVTRVSVTIAPANASADLSRDPAGTFSGTLGVSAGTQTVTASAWNGSTLVGSGTGSAVVTAGQTADVSITVPGGTSPGSDH